jgi:quercetin dioxygenase-like cupin family protein
MSAVEIVLGVNHLEANIAFFTERLGLTLDAIYPADSPQIAVLSGRGVRIRLDNKVPLASACLSTEPTPSNPAGSALIAPNGTRIEFTPAFGAAIPALTPEYVVTHLARAGSSSWATGRASMAYRDLIPSRLGGFVIASHIRIDVGGPVPDYVHFHELRAQMIYCLKGTATLVYEGQGEPFTFSAGDLVVQPPTIRHRVLETSDAFEVLEISCPAEHVTHTDPALTLPTPQLMPDALFAGQRFLHDRRINASFVAKPGPEAASVESWATEAAEATAGVLRVDVHRASGAAGGTWASASDQLRMFFVAAGKANLTAVSEQTAEATAPVSEQEVSEQEVSSAVSEQEVEIPPEMVGYGAFAAVPNGVTTFSDWTSDFEVIEVQLTEAEPGPR